tara:strand:- start:93 stop:371 length:279 start_codon:yes stop_codon:yes gene_type:complete
MYQIASFLSLLKTAIIKALNKEIKFWGICAFSTVYLAFEYLGFFVGPDLDKMSNLSDVKQLSLEVMGILGVCFFIMLFFELFEDKLMTKKSS